MRSIMWLWWAVVPGFGVLRLAGGLMFFCFCFLCFSFVSTPRYAPELQPQRDLQSLWSRVVEASSQLCGHPHLGQTLLRVEMATLYNCPSRALTPAYRQYASPPSLHFHMRQFYSAYLRVVPLPPDASLMSVSTLALRNHRHVYAALRCLEWFCALVNRPRIGFKLRGMVLRSLHQLQLTSFLVRFLARCFCFCFVFALFLSSWFVMLGSHGLTPHGHTHHHQQQHQHQHHQHASARAFNAPGWRAVSGSVPPGR